MFRQIGPTEILLILGVVLLLFGGRKLPELARGSGRALRIFKSEVKELKDDERDQLETSDSTTARREDERDDVARPEATSPEARRSTTPEQG